MAKTLCNINFDSSAPARFQQAVDISATDFTCPAETAARIRGIHFSGPAGTGVVVGRLVDDDEDSTWTLASTIIHALSFSIIRKLGTTATGIRLLG